jgi:hypothetical protein
MATIAEQMKRRGSQGNKIVYCVRCTGQIQPYAGQPVSLNGRYAHQAGQCKGIAERSATVREMAGQGELFAWSCRKVEPAADIPHVCDVTGTDRAEYAAHMRTHGLTAPKPAAARIRLRKSAPAATLDKPSVNPFKFLHWHETLYGEWQAGIGNPVIGEADRRGQYWAEGPNPHSVWVVPLHPAPWETLGQPAKPVCLYSHGDGTWSTDWSKAKYDRRDANRRSKSLAA